MSKRYHVVVLKEEAGQRLDKFLSQKTPFSRSRIAALWKEGTIVPPTALDSKVKEGQIFEITEPDAVPDRLIPEAQKLDILYEDEAVLVLNKPPFVVVHPGAGNPSGTLVHALLAHCGESLSGIGGVKRPGIVHRIDKETSGVLVIAKTDEAHQKLSEQFARHTIRRIYQAFVYGMPTNGRIEGNIGRSPTNRQKMAIVKTGGKPAVTHYRLIKPLFGGKAAWIECRLETGRTHQIRVHMTSIGHPLVGDKVYGHAPKGMPEILRLFPRQALHAGVLGFVHPLSGKYMEFSAPMPEDMALLAEASKII